MSGKDKAFARPTRLLVPTRRVGTRAKMAAPNVGRNKSVQRQQGRMFPAIGAPETPVLRLTRGQAYSGLRLRDSSFPRAASRIRKTLVVTRGAARLDCIPTRRVGTKANPVLAFLL